MTRKTAIAAVVVLVAAGGGTAWWLTTPRSTGTPANASVPVDTAVVARTTLVRTTQLSGTLGYAGTYTVTPQLAGTITALPTAGSVITRGQHAYEVDGVPVYLFYGARPTWRAFGSGMTPGPDVRELERNLRELGFGGELLVDDTFTWATAQAIGDWQRATGQAVTGQVDLGRIVVLPGALRVQAAATSPGAPAAPGQPVLTASSRIRVVTVPVPATQTYLVHVHDRVTVTLPSGASTSGWVSELSPVATLPSAGDQSNGPSVPTVPALVRLARAAVAAGLDQAPVTVSVIDERVTGVLAVPVTALVALSGGGYAVWVYRSAADRRLVAVTPGLFADALVQVTAPQLHAGDRVEVPRP